MLIGDRTGAAGQKLLHPDPRHFVLHLAVVLLLQTVLLPQPAPAPLLEDFLLHIGPGRFLSPAGRGGHQTLIVSLEPTRQGVRPLVSARAAYPRASHMP